VTGEYSCTLYVLGQKVSIVSIKFVMEPETSEAYYTRYVTKVLVRVLDFAC